MRRPIAPSCVAGGSPGAGHTPCLPRLSVWAPGYATRVPVSSGVLRCASQATHVPYRCAYDQHQAPTDATAPQRTETTSGGERSRMPATTWIIRRREPLRDVVAEQQTGR